MASRTNEEDNDFYNGTDSDEELFYEQTIRKMRLEVNRGKTYEQACKSLSGVEKYLQKEIGEDFLKVIIAERHFSGGYGIDDIALLLDVPYDKVEEIRNHMLSDLSGVLDRGKRWPDSDLSN
jgi:hypothetical protein